MEDRGWKIAGDRSSILDLLSSIFYPHLSPVTPSPCHLVILSPLRRAILLLAQEQQEVAGLLLVLGAERVVERQEGVALAVRLGELVVILFGRLADQVERRGAEHGRQALQFADARAGAGRLDRADIRAACA